MLKSIVYVAAFAMLAASCEQPASTPPNEVTPAVSEASSALSAPAPAASEESGVALSIPSDPKASYRVLAVERGGKGLLLIQTKRSGSSGVSFSERQVDCGANTFAYTREGETLEELLAAPRKPDPMGPRVSGSISDVVSQYACDHPPA